MKARGSTDPKVGKKNDDQDEDSHGQDEDHVEEKDPPTDAALKEGQKEVVDHPQDEMGEVGDSRSEIRDLFHIEDATLAVWGKADDILTISKAESQAAEPPRVFTHDEKLYTNDNLLRIISEEKYDRGVTGMCEDWMVRQQGVLFIKLRWAITEGLKIYVHACDNHRDMMNRAEELIASVGEEYRVTVTRRLTKGWQEQGIPKTWRPVLDVWYEQEEKLKAAAAAAARKKRNKKKEKKDKRKRLEAEEEDEEVPAQEPGVTGNATDVQSLKMQESVIAEGTTHAGRPDPQDRELRVMRRQSHKLNKERKQSAEEAEEGAGADTGKARLEYESVAPAEVPDEVKPDATSSHIVSPAVRRIAAEQEIDPKNVEGTGKAGRVTKSDMLAALESQAKSPEAPAVSSPTSAATSEPKPERSTRKRMSPLRRKIAERLVAAQQETAMLTTFNEVDLTVIKALRSKYQESFVKKHGIKLGFMSFFVKAVVRALEEVPAINAMLDGDEIVQNHFFDIGIAVSTKKGLLVPVVRDCDQLGLAGIESEIINYAGKARDGKIALDDIQGGVFTITNGGIFGSMLSTPILNPPQSAILGMHAIQDRPVAINGEVVIRPMMYLALSYDHRIVDGKEAVTFLVKIKEAIEDPARLVIGI